MAIKSLVQVSRAELAKATGMSQPTVGKIVDELLNQQILEETSEQRADPTRPGPRIGRPGLMVRLDQTRKHFLAIQIGALFTRLARLPIAASSVDRWELEFATPSNAQLWMKTARRAMKELTLPNMNAILLSVPGVVDEMKNQVLLCPNLRWAEKVDWSELTLDYPNVPFLPVQEIRALAMGQLAIEPDNRDFLLVDFGDGVGGSAVINGKLYSSSPMTGELGHIPIPNNDRPCGCGSTGCVETLISRKGLLQTFARQSSKTNPVWADLVRHVNRFAIEPWLEEPLEAIGTAITSAINVLGVHRVVITGSLTELPPLVIDRLGQLIRQGAMWNRFGQVTCVGAPRRRTAGLVTLAIDRLLCPGVEN